MDQSLKKKKKKKMKQNKQKDILEQYVENVPKSYENAIMSMPFGSLYRAIIEGKITPLLCYPYAKAYQKIVRLYDEKRSSFLINGKLIRITANDIALIFGLPARGQPLKQTVKPGTPYQNTPFHIRCLESAKAVRRSGIEKALEFLVSAEVTSTQGRDEVEDAQDFARCVILLMICLVYDANANYRVELNVIANIENFEEISKFKWVTVFHSKLATQLKNTIPSRTVLPGQ